MTNADKFKNIFGLYATELWSMPEKDFLKWLNSEAMNSSEFPNNSDTISRQAAIDICTSAIDLWSGQLGEGALVAVRNKIAELPSALGTNLAEVGTDLATKRTVKGFPIDADLLMLKVEEEYGFRARDRLYEIIRTMPKYDLPSAQPKNENLKFLEFLWNTINPNEMEQYLEMYSSKEVKSNG